MVCRGSAQHRAVGGLGAGFPDRIPRGEAGSVGAQSVVGLPSNSRVNPHAIKEDTISDHLRHSGLLAQ